MPDARAGPQMGKLVFVATLLCCTLTAPAWLGRSAYNLGHRHRHRLPWGNVQWFSYGPCICMPGEVAVEDPKIPVSRSVADTQTFDNFMEKCLDNGQVAAYHEEKDLKCYNLNTQGPCMTGQKLVADLKTKTRCITYKDSKGAACPPLAVFFSYKGRCRFLGDDCGGCGRRLVVDAFGEGSCSCDVTLGFVEWTDGSCHQEGTQGPCQAGEHLLEDSKTGGLDCVFHGCPQNYTKWPTPEDDDLCYRVDCNNCNSPMELKEMPGKSLDSVRSKEDLPGVLSLQCIDDFDVRGANFGDCVKEESDGSCLKRARSKTSGKVSKTKLKSIYD